MRKIVILDASTLGDVPNLKALDKYGSIISYPATAYDDTADRLQDAEIVITNKAVVDRAVMKQSPGLKFICVSATGMNNIDLEAAKEFGITVKNATGYGSSSVAQHTFACIFQLYNQIGYYDAYVKNGDYCKSEIFTHYGPVIRELRGKKFGIIGLGNIGLAVAKIADAYGAEVSYHSTSGKNNNAEYAKLDLDELLSTSDIVSIHAPLNADTRNLLSDRELGLMKAEAILINMGRGGIVDEHALAKAIDDKKISGACLDVYVKEPIEGANPLLDVKFPQRLVLTPHSAWASIEARIRLVDIVVKNIKEYVETGS